MFYCVLIAILLLLVLFIFSAVDRYRNCVPVMPEPGVVVDDGCSHQVWIGGDEGYFKSTAMNIDGVYQCALCREELEVCDGED